MYKHIILFSIILLFRSPAPLSFLNVEITSPKEGQVVQGNVDILGSAAGDGFESAELAYAYANSENLTWFEIDKISQPVNVALLSDWDTTTISDGDYQLRLTVHYQDGTSNEAFVKKVLVRNYTPVVVTPTQKVTDAIVAQAATSTPMTSLATPFPANKAALSVAAVNRTFEGGAVIGFVCILCLGIYVALHGMLRRR
jgi:hypothetical protein